MPIIYAAVAKGGDGTVLAAHAPHSGNAAQIAADCMQVCVLGPKRDTNRLQCRLDGLQGQQGWCSGVAGRRGGRLCCALRTPWQRPADAAAASQLRPVPPHPRPCHHLPQHVIASPDPRMTINCHGCARRVAVHAHAASAPAPLLRSCRQLNRLVAACCEQEAPCWANYSKMLTIYNGGRNQPPGTLSTS